MDEITLPKELAECELSLEEIGAIFVLYSLKNIDEDSQSYWSTNENMVNTGQTLTERGIVKFSKNDEDENIMEIDITNVELLKKDFWEVYDYDDNNNEILFHYSYRNKDRKSRYELHPKLYNNKIVWNLKFSDFGFLHGYYPIESLEAGEKIVRQKLLEELEELKQEELLK
jgi:hypothetical protein